MPNSDELTPRQRRFVQRYLIDLNATAAYKEVYQCNQASADASGPRLLENVRICNAIAAAQQKVAERAEVEAVAVLKELARIGFSDMRRFTGWSTGGVKLRDSEELAADDSRCVAEVSQTITKEGGSIRFKLHDKVAALTLLGKHLGMFPERVVVDDPAKLSDEELAAKRDDTAKRLKLVS